MSMHVRMRMKQRKIAEWEITATIRHPMSPATQTPKGSVCYRRMFPPGHILKVWVVDPPVNGELKVKSAAWKGEDDDDTEDHG